MSFPVSLQNLELLTKNNSDQHILHIFLPFQGFIPLHYGITVLSKT